MNLCNRDFNACRVVISVDISLFFLRLVKNLSDNQYKVILTVDKTTNLFY